MESDLRMSSLDLERNAFNNCRSNGNILSQTTSADSTWVTPSLNRKQMTKCKRHEGSTVLSVKTCKIRPSSGHAKAPNAGGCGGLELVSDSTHGTGGLGMNAIEGWSNNLGVNSNCGCGMGRKLQLNERDTESGNELPLSTNVAGIISQMNTSDVENSTMSGDVILFNPPDLIPKQDSKVFIQSETLYNPATRVPNPVSEATQAQNNDRHNPQQLTVFQSLQTKLKSSFSPASPSHDPSSRKQTMIPFPSTGMPSWHPRKQLDLQNDRYPRSLTQHYQTPLDIRSIASGGLVDIEIPSSFASSSVSVAGSQVTLISSPYKSGSVRRSLSADSLFSLRNSEVDLKQNSHMLLPVSSTAEEVKDELRAAQEQMENAMRRTGSLDQLPLVSPYPMPTLPCYERAKTPEMVRSMSYEERASLALSMDDCFCRICWQGADGEECIQPCFCHSYVHLSCIQRWLSIAKITYCEVCRYQFKARRKMKPTSQWRWWPSKNRHLAQLEATIILLGVVTPPLLCGIILCSQKISEYLTTPDNAWKTAGLMTLVMVSAGTYLGAILYFCHKFATVCRMWVESNRTTVVTVVPLTPAERRPVKKSPSQVWTIS